MLSIQCGQNGYPVTDTLETMAETVSTAKKRAKAPVKVRFEGYTAASDEWVGGDRRGSAVPGIWLAVYGHSRPYTAIFGPYTAIFGLCRGGRGGSEGVLTM